MKFCKHCGNHLYPHQKVCTRCGKQIIRAQQKVRHHEYKSSYPRGHFNDSYRFRKLNKPMVIISILVAIITIMLISVFFFFKHQLSPYQTVEQISDVLKKEDVQQLSKLITSDGHKLNDEETKAYLNFLKNHNKLKELSHDLTKSLEQMNQSNATSHVVNLNQLTIMKIEKKGKTLGLFEHYEFNIPHYSISTYAQDNGKIYYEYKGKTHTINLKKDQPVDVGRFPLGDYQLKAKKEVNHQTFKGNLVIMMKPVHSIVKENFKEKRFMIKISNSYKVKDVRLFIKNKDSRKAKEYKTYGHYTSSEKVVIHAEGKVGQHKVKTKSEEVQLPEGVEDYKTITLKFNSDEVNQFVEDQLGNDSKKDNKENEDKSKDKEDDSKK